MDLETRNSNMSIPTIRRNVQKNELQKKDLLHLNRKNTIESINEKKTLLS